MPFFHSTTPRHQDEKGHPVPNLCILLSVDILSQMTAIVHFTTSSASLSTLPLCPYIHTYIYTYIHMCSRKPADSLAHSPPHDHLCSLIGNTQQANSHTVNDLSAPFSTSKTLLNQDEEGHPPFNDPTFFCFYLLSGTCDATLYAM